MANKDLFDLSGQTAIVTGASSGLGVTFCEALAEAGADLAVCARRVEKMEETAQMVRALGRRCLAVKADVTDPGQIDAFVDKVLAEYGKIDILVNNAGVSLFEAKSATDADFDAFDAVMETNVIGSAMLAHQGGQGNAGPRIRSDNQLVFGAGGGGGSAAGSVVGILDLEA